MFNIVKSIRTRYRWALIAIALLISVSALLMQYVFSVQKYDAKIINIAGKQRMLSQKIAWHSNALINQTANNEQHLKSLAHSLRLFEQGHTFLLTKNKQGEAIYLNAALVDLYYAAPGNLDAEVSSFIKQAKKLLTQQEQANPGMFSVGEIEALLKKLALWPCLMPIVAQKIEQPGRQHHLAILPPFALHDMDEHPVAVDIAGGEIANLGSSQTCTVRNA